MDNLMNFIGFFERNSAFLMPVLLSITILGLSLGAAGLFQDKLFRTLVIIPSAIVFYAMGLVANDFGREVFFNLSAELLTAGAALIILLFYSIFEGWASVLAIVGFFALLLLAFFDSANQQANLFINLSTGLVGSFLIVALIRREWDFSPANREKMLWANVRERHKKLTESLAEMGDYYILVLGGDEDEVKTKIEFLHDSNIDALPDENTIKHDEETTLYYRLMNGKIVKTVKQEEAIFLTNQEAQMRLLAYPDTVKRVYKQIKEVLETSEEKRLEAPDPQMVNMQFKVQVPKVIFSDYLETQIVLLARKWRHGDDENLILATDDLLEWAKEMQFIKE